MRKQASSGNPSQKLVQREIKIPGDASSPLSTAMLVELAEELVPSRDRSTVLDLKLTIYAQSKSNVLNGTARLMYRKDEISIWETDLLEPDGEVVARLTYTLLADPDAALHAMEATAERPAKDRKAAVSLEERREAIARAACDVISRNGFAASSIREIAAAAGMHVPTLYQYVSSKDEVLELVYRWVISDVKTSIADALKLPLPPSQRLVAVTMKLLEVNARTPRHTGVLNRELRSLSKVARGRVLADYEAIITSVADIIAEGIKCGEFRVVNPRIAANFIDALCDMWALRKFAVGQFSLDEYEKEIIQYIKSGLFICCQEDGKVNPVS